MKIVIDAWLERKEPQIRFLDGDSAAVLLQVGPALTRQMLERGEICAADLQSPPSRDLLNLLSGMLGFAPAFEPA